MRSLPVTALLLSATLAACGGDDDLCAQCHPDGPGAPDTGFAGTWQAQRAEIARDCSLDVEPRLDVRILIEGNETDGYTAVDAFNVGTPGNSGTLNADRDLVVSFQEYWPGLGSQPDVAPGVSFVLARDGQNALSGTSRANAFYSVGGELVNCLFAFTLTATRVAPGS